MRPTTDVVVGRNGIVKIPHLVPGYDSSGSNSSLVVSSSGSVFHSHNSTSERQRARRSRRSSVILVKNARKNKYDYSLSIHLSVSSFLSIPEHLQKVGSTGSVHERERKHLTSALSSAILGYVDIAKGGNVQNPAPKV
jgi:hypothetical protein